MTKHLFLLVSLVAFVHAQDLSIQHLDMPVYSQAGVLEQRLRSASASGSVLRPTLKLGVIEFYTAAGKIIDAGAKLTFDEATYNHDVETVEGDGLICFSSAQGDIAGVGFRYNIKTQLLTLKSQVIAHFQGAEIVGQTAEAFVQKQSEDHHWAIEEALISGGAVVTGFKHGKLQFDRAESETAKYLGKQGVVVMSSPVKAWKDGKKSEISGSGDITIPVTQTRNQSKE